jgi:hypothetical protein
VEESASFDRHTIDYIQRASATGLYEIRGMGAKRRLPHFDDLLLLGASLSRYPLEGYREKCSTKDAAGHALCEAAAGTRHPHHHSGHELRGVVRECEGSAGPRRQRGGHLHHHR